MRWLMSLFLPKRLVATVDWKINWTDIGGSEKGQWLLYESTNGYRSFRITNRACLTGTSGHPGYAHCLAWKAGGRIPYWADIL